MLLMSGHDMMYIGEVLNTGVHELEGLKESASSNYCYSHQSGDMNPMSCHADMIIFNKENNTIHHQITLTDSTHGIHHGCDKCFRATWKWNKYKYIFDKDLHLRDWSDCIIKENVIMNELYAPDNIGHVLGDEWLSIRAANKVFGGSYVNHYMNMEVLHGFRKANMDKIFQELGGEYFGLKSGCMVVKNAILGTEYLDFRGIDSYVLRMIIDEVLDRFSIKPEMNRNICCQIKKGRRAPLNLDHICESRGYYILNHATSIVEQIREMNNCTTILSPAGGMSLPLIFHKGSKIIFDAPSPTGIIKIEKDLWGKLPVRTLHYIDNTNSTIKLTPNGNVDTFNSNLFVIPEQLDVLLDQLG